MRLVVAVAVAVVVMFLHRLDGGGIKSVMQTRGTYNSNKETKCLMAQ